MSSTPPLPFICHVESQVPFNAEDLCAPLPQSINSPIDVFYKAVDEVLLHAASPSFATNPTLGRSLLLGLISATEAYFRSVLAKVVSLCPLCRELAVLKSVALCAVDYYKKDQAAQAIFDHQSFATAGVLKKQIEGLTHLTLREGSSVIGAVRQFETLSIFRHAAVHAYGELSPGNLVELNVGIQKRMVVRVDIVGIHTAAEVCINTVRAVNRFLFEGILGKWAVEGVIRGRWRSDRKRFLELIRAFGSTKDNANKPLRAYDKYRNALPHLRSIIGTS